MSKNTKGSSGIKKGIIASVCILAAVFTAVGTTAAFLSRRTEPIEANFLPSEVSCSVIEKGGAYRVVNTGDTAVFVRVLPVFSWKDDDGSVYAKKQPSEGEDYEATFNTDNWFFKDGYYYHMYPINEGESSADLIEELEVFTDGAPDGYGLTVELVASAIQSAPRNAVEDYWGVTVAWDGGIRR